MFPPHHYYTKTAKPWNLQHYLFSKKRTEQSFAWEAAAAFDPLKEQLSCASLQLPELPQSHVLIFPSRDSLSEAE